MRREEGARKRKRDKVDKPSVRLRSSSPHSTRYLETYEFASPISADSTGRAAGARLDSLIVVESLTLSAAPPSVPRLLRNLPSEHPKFARRPKPPRCGVVVLREQRVLRA